MIPKTTIIEIFAFVRMECLYTEMVNGQNGYGFRYSFWVKQRVKAPNPNIYGTVRYEDFSISHSSEVLLLY